MLQTIDRDTHDHVGKVFTHLANAINDRLLYTREHPRFHRAVETVEELIARFFELNADSGSLTFTFNRQQLEFRDVPLVDVGVHGERLTETLSELDCKALQFLRGVAREDLFELVSTLSGYTGPSCRRRSDPPRAADTAKYRFLYGLPEEDLFVSDAELSVDEAASTPDDEAPITKGFRSAAKVARTVATSYRPILANVADGHAFSTTVLKKATRSVVSQLAEQDHRALPAPLGGYFDDFLLNHSINVCLTTTRAASLLFTDREKLSRIALAALLHDLGKSRVPLEIIHKSGRLSECESACLRGHATLGADLLLGLRTVDPLSVTVASGHHQAMHPPRGVRESGLGPCWVTDLVAVIDVFETLTAVRPYKSGLSPQLAFATMLRMPALNRCRPFIKLLYEAVGPYPVGSFVELTSGERAVVVELNSARPAYPKVRALTDATGKRLKDPLDIDLARFATDAAAAPAIARPLVRQTRRDDVAGIDARPEPKEILGSALEDVETLMAREG